MVTHTISGSEDEVFGDWEGGGEGGAINCKLDYDENCVILFGGVGDGYLEVPKVFEN